MKKLLILALIIVIGHSAMNRDNLKEIVKDTNTGLMWQDNADVVIRKEISDSRFYCSNLVLGGYDDWQTPAPKMLRSMQSLKAIVDEGKFYGYSWVPNKVFKYRDVEGDEYWTSKDGGSVGGYVGRGSSEIQYMYDFSEKYLIRCVRDMNHVEPEQFKKERTEKVREILETENYTAMVENYDEIKDELKNGALGKEIKAKDEVFKKKLGMPESYNSCRGCHGVKGEISAMNKSKIINTMSYDDITKAIHGYQNGTYGGMMKVMMVGQVKKLSEQDIEDIANYLSEDNSKPVENKKGEDIYPMSVDMTHLEQDHSIIGNAVYIKNDGISYTKQNEKEIIMAICAPGPKYKIATGIFYAGQESVQIQWNPIVYNNLTSFLDYHQVKANKKFLLCNEDGHQIYNFPQILNSDIKYNFDSEHNQENVKLNQINAYSVGPQRIKELNLEPNSRTGEVNQDVNGVEHLYKYIVTDKPAGTSEDVQIALVFDKLENNEYKIATGIIYGKENSVKLDWDPRTYNSIDETLNYYNASDEQKIFVKED